MKTVKELIPYIVIIAVVVLFRSYIATPVRVDGDSMNPTLHDGQILILNKLDKEYERMEIVVFGYKTDRLIKRVIGLPGETVEIKDNIIYINDEKIADYSDEVKMSDYKKVTVPEGYYFVLGDNRNNSADSRLIGMINKDDIEGSICLRLFPFNKLGSV